MRSAAPRARHGAIALVPVLLLWSGGATLHADTASGAGKPAVPAAAVSSVLVCKAVPPP